MSSILKQHRNELRKIIYLVYGVFFCAFFSNSIQAQDTSTVGVSNDSILKISNYAVALIKSHDSLETNEGFKLFNRAELLAEKSKDTLLILRIYLNKLNFQLDNNIEQHTKVYLDKTLELLSTVDYPLERGKMLQAQGIYISKYESKQKALPYFIEAENLIRKHGTPEDNVKISFKLANLFKENEQWEESVYYALNGLNNIKTPVHITFERRLNILLLYNYAKLNNLKAANEYLPIVNSYLEFENNKRILLLSHEALGAYFRATKNFATAAYHYQLQFKLNDLYYFKQSQIRLNFSTLEYKLENEKEIFKKQQAKNNLDLIELKQDRAELYVKKTINVIVIVIAVLLALLVILLYRKARFKERFNSILQSNYDEVLLAKSKAENMLEIRSNFLKTITHKLKNPLISIIGISYLLGRFNLNEEDHKHVETLRISGNNLLKLVNNVLSINTISTKKEQLTLEKTDLKQVISRILETFNKESSTNKLVYNIDPAIPNAVYTDCLRLTQVLNNLLDNAFKFTENGTVFLGITQVMANSHNSTIQFTIEDTGIGIPKDRIEDIYSPYSQGSIEIQKKYGGNGIGLTVVKKILTDFKSSLIVDSDVNKGTNVKFIIDFKLPQTSTITNNLNEKELKEIISKSKILVIENNKITQFITSEIIQSFGFHCDVASNGFEAIKLQEREKFNMILMNSSMLVMGGVETAKLLKQYYPNLPILLLTELSVSELQNQYDISNLSVDAIRSKIFPSDELLDILITYIHKNEISKALTNSKGVS